MKKLSISGVMPRTLIAFSAALLSSRRASDAQNQVGFKANLLYAATGAINLGVKVAMAHKLSFHLNGNFDGWSNDGHLCKYWLVLPDICTWFCDRSIGHFLGMHRLLMVLKTRFRRGISTTLLSSCAVMVLIPPTALGVVMSATPTLPVKSVPTLHSCAV